MSGAPRRQHPAGSASRRASRTAAAGLAVALLLPASVAVGAATRKAPDCRTCHSGLLRQKKVHAAVQMGCETCHAGLDARQVPHRSGGKLPHGLSAPLPDLCFQCHEQAEFGGPVVHAALSLGCNACHDPHASRQAHLLSRPLPQACFGCHDASEFRRKVVHPPAKQGRCFACHRPHASNEPSLLVDRPVQACRSCHPMTGEGSHLAAFQAGRLQRLGPSGEPLPPDPSRPARGFYCTACHEAHGASNAWLLRGNVKAPYDVCTRCHRDAPRR